jgi:cytosine/creatinine deaminase
MLEVAFLAAHLLWMTARAEIEMLYDMVTVAPARAMKIAGFGLEVGVPAAIVGK